MELFRFAVFMFRTILKWLVLGFGLFPSGLSFLVDNDFKINCREKVEDRQNLVIASLLLVRKGFEDQSSRVYKYMHVLVLELVAGVDQFSRYKLCVI